MSTDFDFFTGTWDGEHRRRVDYLDEASEWEEFPSVTRASRHFDGAANFDEIEFPTRGLRGLTLRLYDPKRDEWSLHWASSRDGLLTVPVVGRFADDGTGDFYADDVWEGKDIRVRYRWSGITATTAHWEQAFSLDGDRTWLTNWHMQFTRREDQAG
jgi:hypothetical protein